MGLVIWDGLYWLNPFFNQEKDEFLLSYVRKVGYKLKMEENCDNFVTVLFPV